MLGEREQSLPEGEYLTQMNQLAREREQALQALACLIHVGMKRLLPDEDSGLGIGAEYEEAVRLHGR